MTAWLPTQLSIASTKVLDVYGEALKETDPRRIRGRNHERDQLLRGLSRNRKTHKVIESLWTFNGKFLPYQW